VLGSRSHSTENIPSDGADGYEKSQR
jgi:hypothetical protein